MTIFDNQKTNGARGEGAGRIDFAWRRPCSNSRVSRHCRLRTVDRAARPSRADVSPTNVDQLEANDEYVRPCERCER